MASVVGYATLQLIPSLAGVGIAIRQQLGGELGSVGRESGEQVGDNVGEGLRAGLKTAAVAGGLALAAGLVASTVGAMNAEAVTDKLSAQLNLTGPASQAAGKIAGDLYSGAYVDSLDQGAELVRAVATNIGTDINSVDFAPITTKVADLANAFDLDLGGATTAVGQLMRTGMATDATDALNIITAGLQGPANRAGDLLDTFTEYPALFERLGLSGATSLGLIEQGLAAGARNSDLVGDALKEFQIRATDGSKTSAAGFEALGLSAEKLTAQIAAGGEGASAGLDLVLDRLRGMQDPVERNAAAVALFGTQAEDLGAALFALDPSEAAAGLGDLSTRVSDLGTTLNDNAQTNLVSFGRQMKMAFIDVVGGQVLPVVSSVASVLATQFGPALADVGSAISASITFYQQNSEVLNTLGVVVGVLALGLGALALTAGISSGALAAWFATTALGTGITTALTGAQAALNLVMSANPIALVVIAVAALVAGLVYFFTQTEAGRAVVEAVWGAIQTAIGATVDWVTGTVVPALSSAWEAVVSGVTAVKDWVVGAFDAISGFFMKWWPLLLVIFLPGIAVIVALWNRFGDDVINSAKAAWGLVKDYILTPVGEFIAGVREKVGAVVGWLKEQWALVQLGAQIVWAQIKTNILGPITEAVDGVRSKALEIVAHVTGPLTKAKDDALDKARAFLDVGSAIIDGIKEGISKGASALAGAVRDAASKALQAAKDFLGIKSPSRVFRSQVGLQIPAGIAEGIRAGAAGVQAAVDDLVTVPDVATAQAVGATVASAGSSAAAAANTGPAVFNIYDVNEELMGSLQTASGRVLNADTQRRTVAQRQVGRGATALLALA